MLYLHIALGNGLLSRQIHNSGEYRGETRKIRQVDDEIVYK